MWVKGFQVVKNNLLFGGAVEENSEIVSNFFKILIKDVRFLESNIFEIATHSGIHKVEFKLAELPNGTKMVAFFAGELSNAATYFCTFANVRRNEANDCKKTLGEEPKNYWTPFTYEKRLQDAKKVQAKSMQLGKKVSAVSLHSKILAYIANESKSRQYKQPLVEEFIDFAKAEPLHLKNNVVKERFIILFKICVSQSDFGSVKSFKDIRVDALFSKFVKFVQKNRWVNDNSGKVEKDFTFRFKGKKSLLYMKHFPPLIRMLRNEINDRNIRLKVLAVHFQPIHLRQLLSYSVRITDFDFGRMTQEALSLFRCCCVFDVKISPSLWTLCNFVPFHAGKCLSLYNMGPVCNTMEVKNRNIR